MIGEQFPVDHAPMRGGGVAGGEGRRASNRASGATSIAPSGRSGTANAGRTMEAGGMHPMQLCTAIALS